MHFPSGDKGHILVTTRSPPPGGVDSVHVSEMDPEEEKGFLLWAAGLTLPWRKSELEWAVEVISEFSPKVNLLTLTHVGAPIRNGLCTQEDYVSLLKEQQTLLERQQTKQNKPEDLVLKVALKQIRKQKTRSSVDAFTLLMASPDFATRYITLDTLAESILPIKTAWKQQRLGHHAQEAGENSKISHRNSSEGMLKFSAGLKSHLSNKAQGRLNVSELDGQSQSSLTCRFFYITHGMIPTRYDPP
ncbi:hypothetical protein N7465_006482 [Penicillium sp. CMV-2018d]|nr:hypothetical protein N7465_006482 [Penicillium sp. CMV-2018d]